MKGLLSKYSRALQLIAVQSLLTPQGVAGITDTLAGDGGEPVQFAQSFDVEFHPPRLPGTGQKVCGGGWWVVS